MQKRHSITSQMHIIKSVNSIIETGERHESTKIKQSESGDDFISPAKMLKQ